MEGKLRRYYKCADCHRPTPTAQVRMSYVDWQRHWFDGIQNECLYLNIKNVFAGQFLKKINAYCQKQSSAV
jgi:hypothetical protein